MHICHDYHSFKEYKNPFYFLVDSLESARKSAANDNYHTTDDELLGRGKRQHVSYNRYSSEEENSDNSVYRTSKGKSMYYNIKYVLQSCLTLLRTTYFCNIRKREIFS